MRKILNKLVLRDKLYIVSEKNVTRAAEGLV